MAERQSANKVGVLGPILGLVGGALIGAGAVVPWAQSEGISVESVVVPGDVRGWEASLGLFAVAAGILAFVLALAIFLTAGRATRLLGAGFIIAALVAGTVVTVSVLDLSQTYIDFAIARASGAGLPIDGVEGSIRQLMELGSLNVDPGLGLWLAGGGVALILVGGSLVLVAGPRHATVPVDMGFDSTR